MNPSAHAAPEPTVTRQPRGRSILWRLGESKFVAGLSLVLALGVLAGRVGLGALYVRVHLREQLVDRDGEVLYTVALARQYANGAGEDLTRRLGDPAAQLALALDISQMIDGVLGVRLFDPQGRFVTAVPPTLIETNLPPELLPALRQLHPISRYQDDANLENYFWMESSDPAGTTTPLLEVNIPLHARGQTNLLAAAQLLVEGSRLAKSYASVDAHLWLLAFGLFAVGAALLAGILVWAYRRLQQANLLLEARSQLLLRANHELALAAKTSALGSVTAHLIHGLSNPLANLQDFIAAHGGNGMPATDFEAVATATRRMQQLVHDVVRVLGEERGGDQYQVSLGDLVSVLNHKLQGTVRDSGANLVTEINTTAEISNRHANLVLLILENLIHNALQVTPKGKSVVLRFAPQPEGIRCEVEDCGPGIPAGIAPVLFTPCRSTQGGSGLGLAISKQLAAHLGATLELMSSSPSGSTFVLKLPATLFSEATTAAVSTTRPLRL